MNSQDERLMKFKPQEFALNLLQNNESEIWELVSCFYSFILFILVLMMIPLTDCRFTKDSSRFKDELDTMKFICKDFWNYVYKKQIDNLRTNHQVRPMPNKLIYIYQCWSIDLPSAQYIFRKKVKEKMPCSVLNFLFTIFLIKWKHSIHFLVLSCGFLGFTNPSECIERLYNCFAPVGWLVCRPREVHSISFDPFARKLPNLVQWMILRSRWPL